MTEHNDHYLSDAAYDRLVEELMSPAPFLLDQESHIKFALGEIGNVWPEHVRPHTISA